MSHLGKKINGVDHKGLLVRVKLAVHAYTVVFTIVASLSIRKIWKDEMKKELISLKILFLLKE